jgi:transposase
MTIRVRALSDDEVAGLARMVRSRTLGAGLVRRAQIVQHAVADGLSAPEVAARMDLCGATVRFWLKRFNLKRFNARGLAGLEEDMRSGRPPTYSAEERSAVITAALSRPAELGLPFASWTLDRLVAYLGERGGVGMKRSRVSEVLLAEGLKWRQEETWFGARVDPAFARKGGDRAALHRPAHGQCRRLPRRDGTASQQELPRPAGSQAGRARRGAGSPGDRLRPARRGRLRVRRLLPGNWSCIHRDLREAQHRELDRLPGRGGGLDQPRGRAGLCRDGHVWTPLPEQEKSSGSVRRLVGC